MDTQREAALIQEIDTLRGELKFYQSREAEWERAKQERQQIDITERKRAEEQLRYQAALLANVNEAIVASDSQYRLTAWNAAAEALYGWKAEEVLGRNGLEITRTEWPGVEAEVMRRGIAEAGRWRGEATQARRDGTRFPVEVSSIVLRAESGQITGYISVNHDITERKHAEQLLWESEQKHRLLVDNASEAIVVAQDGILKFVNRMASDLTGYSEQELTSRPFPEFIHPDDRGMVIERYLRRIKGDVDQPRYVFRLKARDGSIKWVEIGAVLIDWEGKPATLNFLNNVTERKQAEMQLNEQLEELRRWRQVTLGREVRVLDLKREVNELLVKAGQPLRYPSAETENQ